MLIAARYLVDRLRQPRSRADELAELRRRLIAEPSAGDVPEEEAAAAVEMRRLRVELSGALGAVEACSGCSKGHPLPAGRWSGGHCCSGRTQDVFSNDEVAALRQSGTTPAKLTAPRDDHAGCAFRGPTGCSLDPADRPTLCVRYLCLDLVAELRERGDLAHVKRLASELHATFEKFVRLRSARGELALSRILAP